MGRAVLGVSLSVDGFSAGPNVRETEPMGEKPVTGSVTHLRFRVATA